MLFDENECIDFMFTHVILYASPLCHSHSSETARYKKIAIVVKLAETLLLFSNTPFLLRTIFHAILAFI